MKILVVDDNQEDLCLLSTVLRRYNYEVETAPNGVDALVKILQGEFDMIISDILMPGMDGFQLCRRVKTNEKLKNITFIFYSATYTSPQDEAFALSLGAEKFIIKPKKPEVFIEILQKVIKNQQEKKVTAPCPPCEEEIVYLRQYNERLIKKLEDKVKQLEASNRNLVQNINQRKQIEKALAAEKERLSATLKSKERLAMTLRAIGDAIITIDMKGKVISLNSVAEQLTGWARPEAEGKSLAEIFHLISDKTRQQCAIPVEKVMETGRAVDLDRGTLLVSRDGKEKMVAGSVVSIRNGKNEALGLVMACRDITEKQKVEEELQKASKLESIGILAGGIAHDFNNLLAVIIGHLSLAKMFMNSRDELYMSLTEVEKASQRAKSLTNKLLTFARGGVPIKKITYIGDLLRDSAQFALRGSRAGCSFSIPDDLWLVEIDEGQMSQVINNIFINADQAMPKGGTIQVAVENMGLAEEKIVHGLLLPKGDYVGLSIKDHGIGIPKENLKKVFDPYFTTKKTGTGLGLAASYSIVKKHDGYLIVESEMGVGATFYMYIPAYSKETIGPEKAMRVEKVEEIPLAGRGKILVMDDEEMIRVILGKILTQLGYEVSYSKNGTEAIDLYLKAKKSGDPFNAVIMDLIIPGGMGGDEAVKKLIQIDPGIKAIVSSGYSTDPVMANFKEYGFKGCVAKPYDLQALGKTLRQVMKSNE